MQAIITQEIIFLHFQVLGYLLIVLSMLHLIFPYYFNWKSDLHNISLINRQMMKIHTFFLALIVFLMGILCLYSTDDLIATDLGKNISLGLGVFWLIRLFVQFFGYSSILWKGKYFETIVHIVFSILWMYFTCIFMINFFAR